MATLNGNNAYLYFNGINLSGYWTDTVQKESSAELVDVTAGAGATHVKRAAGLRDNTISFAVVYDNDPVLLASYRAALVEGTKGTLIYGPEGAVTGKPKFECVCILETVTLSQAITMDKVMFELSFSGDGAPTATIEGGSTF